MNENILHPKFLFFVKHVDICNIAHEMRILLTAFEPFGGRQKNASAEALARLQAQDSAHNVSIETQLLPVESGRAPQMLCKIVDEYLPDIVLCLGKAKRDALCIETTGYNERRFAVPDNAGDRFEGTPIEQDGPSDSRVQSQ